MRILFTVVFVLISLLCSAQTGIFAGIGSSPSVQVGFTTTVSDSKSDFSSLLGFGLGYSFAKSGATGTKFESAYLGGFGNPVKKVEKTTYSLFALGGVKYKKIELLVRLGIYNNQLIQNYVEFSSGMASVQRRYHVIVGNEKKVLWGGSIGYYATKRANVFAGYDNANMLFAGVKFIL